MKLAGYEVELVTEYAKKLTWQKRHNTLSDQLYVTAQQNHRMQILDKQVDWCVTDSPLPIGMHYCPDFFPDTFHPFVKEVFNSYNNVNFWINRVKPYNEKGRNQTLEQAIVADDAIKYLMATTFGFDYHTVDGDDKAPGMILKHILERY